MIMPDQTEESAIAEESCLAKIGMRKTRRKDPGYEVLTTTLDLWTQPADKGIRRPEPMLLPDGVRRGPWVQGATLANGRGCDETCGRGIYFADAPGRDEAGRALNSGVENGRAKAVRGDGILSAREPRTRPMRLRFRTLLIFRLR